MGRSPHEQANAEGGKDLNFVPPAEQPTVDVVSPDYQPSKTELDEDTRVGATFDEALGALTKPVRLRYVDRPKARQ